VLNQKLLRKLIAQKIRLNIFKKSYRLHDDFFEKRNKRSITKGWGEINKRWTSYLDDCQMVTGSLIPKFILLIGAQTERQTERQTQTQTRNVWTAKALTPHRVTISLMTKGKKLKKKLLILKKKIINRGCPTRRTKSPSGSCAGRHSRRWTTPPAKKRAHTDIYRKIDG